MQLDILAFGAHPDDVELSCGGTLIKLGAAGYKIGIVSLTRAELGTRGSPEIRKKEFGNAAEIIGAYIHEILDISDGNVEINWPNKVKVIQKIRAYRPKIVFAPYWKVRHPDHGHTSQLVSEAAFFSGLKKIETNQLPYRPNKIIYYPCRYEFKPSFIVDISEFHTKKIMAIQAYKSQFFNPEKNYLLPVRIKRNLIRSGHFQSQAISA